MRTVAILIAFTMLFIMYTYMNRSEYTGYVASIPKKVWTYWDTEKLPFFVDKCIENWRKILPDYTIVVLNKNNLHQYVSIPGEILNHPSFNDKPARFSDLVRLCVLAEHGGVWMDASIMLNEHFDSWLLNGTSDFYGYHINIHNGWPVVESWFFACTKHNDFVRLWKEEFLQIKNFKNVIEYVNSRVKLGVDHSLDDPYYLAIHIAAQKVLQINKYPINKISTTTAADGPYLYLSRNDWNIEKGLEDVCANKDIRKPLMKIRSCERQVIEANKDGKLSNTKCEWFE
jgi:hypothetical protein